MRRNAAMGSKFDIKLVPDMSKMIFQQDKAKADTAVRTQVTLAEHITPFWNKDIGPTNTSDLNPIENLMSILEDKVEEERNHPTKILGLETVLRDAWK